MFVLISRVVKRRILTRASKAFSLSLLAFACTPTFTVDATSEIWKRQLTPTGQPPPMPTPAPQEPVNWYLRLQNSMSFGTHHSCNLDGNGRLYCWGRNSMGELGDATLQQHSTPYQVPTTNRFKSVKSGTHTSCALSVDGEIFCMGSNVDGVLGNGNTIAQSALTRVVGLPNGDPVVEIGLSNPFNLFTDHIRLNRTPHFACALLKSGSVWCWGNNSLGQLGVDPSIQGVSYLPLRISGLSHVKAITVGSGHVCALESDGDLFCWGDNHSSQLGPSTDVTSYAPVKIVSSAQIVQVAAGGAFNCYLDIAGDVWCWGRNSNGELGRGASSIVGSVPAKVRQSAKAISIGSGTMNACLVTAEHNLICWGDNYCGQMADGSSGGIVASPTEINAFPDETMAVSIGTFSMCAVSDAGKMKCWGHAFFGEAGDGVTGRNLSAPSDVLGYSFDMATSH